MFIENLEQEKYLKLDSLFQFTLPVLMKLKGKADLYLVTLRRDTQAATKQINQLGLAAFFKGIRMAGLGPQDKNFLYRALGCGVGDIVVGDTDADINAGRMLKATTVAVTTGLRNEVMLRALRPTHVIHSLLELPKLVGVDE